MRFPITVYLCCIGIAAVCIDISVSAKRQQAATEREGGYAGFERETLGMAWPGRTRGIQSQSPPPQSAIINTAPNNTACYWRKTLFCFCSSLFKHSWECSSTTWSGHNGLLSPSHSVSLSIRMRSVGIFSSFCTDILKKFVAVDKTLLWRLYFDITSYQKTFFESLLREVIPVCFPSLCCFSLFCFNHYNHFHY